MNLIYDLPISLRVLKFTCPYRLDYEFLEGALRYLTNLSTLKILGLENIFSRDDDNNLKIYYLTRLRDLA